MSKKTMKAQSQAEKLEKKKNAKRLFESHRFVLEPEPLYKYNDKEFDLYVFFWSDDLNKGVISSTGYFEKGIEGSVIEELFSKQFMFGGHVVAVELPSYYTLEMADDFAIDDDALYAAALTLMSCESLPVTFYLMEMDVFEDIIELGKQDRLECGIA